MKKKLFVMFTYEAAALFGSAEAELVELLFCYRKFYLDPGRMFFEVELLPPPDVIRRF